jgi:hypothetical protein
MFLRGKAQDWWTWQFHLMSAGVIPAFSSWKDFTSALTEAFRPVELSRRYIDQMLSISQGKQDMRSYIASFNALRAKIPDAFPKQTLSHLFLQGCRPELQREHQLQYPKTLAEYFQHAITLSDLPGHAKPPETHLLMGSQRSGIPDFVISALEVQKAIDLGVHVHVVKLNMVAQEPISNTHTVPGLDQLAPGV